MHLANSRLRTAGAFMGKASPIRRETSFSNVSGVTVLGCFVREDQMGKASVFTIGDEAEESPISSEDGANLDPRARLAQLIVGGCVEHERAHGSGSRERC